MIVCSDNDFIKSFENFESDSDAVVSFNSNEWYAIVDDSKTGPYVSRDEAIKAKIRIRKSKNKEVIDNINK